MSSFPYTEFERQLNNNEIELSAGFNMHLLVSQHDDPDETSLAAVLSGREFSGGNYSSKQITASPVPQPGVVRRTIAPQTVIWPSLTPVGITIVSCVWGVGDLPAGHARLVQARTTTGGNFSIFYNVNDWRVRIIVTG